MSKVSQRIAGGRRAGIFASVVAIAASAGPAVAQGATAMEMAADKPLVRLGLELRAGLADTLGAAAKNGLLHVGEVATLCACASDV